MNTKERIGMDTEQNAKREQILAAIEKNFRRLYLNWHRWRSPSNGTANRRERKDGRGRSDGKSIYGKKRRLSETGFLEYLRKRMHTSQKAQTEAAIL